MPITGKNQVGFNLSNDSKDTFKAVNPSTQEILETEFLSATESEVNEAVSRAKSAFLEFKVVSKDRKADFLDKIADEIIALGDELVLQAVSETGLPEARIIGERGRTVGQLKMFANLVREGSWLEASIDTAIPDRTPVPKPDLRRMLVPLGPVAVFGASNFPLAYSAAGGDVASALAGGNTVIVKAHSSHPGTSELVSSAIIAAAKSTEIPDGVYSHLQDSGFNVGKQLVSHTDVKAVGFTGSFAGGKALYDLAQQRPEPIPVFAEMGSVNPVIILPEALEQRSREIASAYAGSITLGSGQFCTNPGIIIGIDSEALGIFSSSLGQNITQFEPSTMLNKGIFENYRSRKSEALQQTGVNILSTDPQNDDVTRNAGKPAVSNIDAGDFMANPKLHEEVFGPFSLIVKCPDRTTLEMVVDGLSGQLTITVMATENDLQQHRSLLNQLRERAGRLIMNDVPTGVEVCPSMQHGGPFPATTDSRFTAVGAAAIRRFVRPICFQNWPEAFLPSELKDENSYGIWRIVNGEMTKKGIS